MIGETLILAGGSGFLGRTLAKWFYSKCAEVVILSRNARPVGGARVVEWDGRTVGTWARELEGGKAVVNLAGRSVNCRYQEKNRQLMMDSRVESTAVLGRAMEGLKNPPEVWLNSSTATIYRHRYDVANTETEGLYGADSEAKDDFSLEVAHAWEEAFESAFREGRLSGTRGIVMRTAMVFGRERGGVYETLRKLVRLGLEGTMGHGRQFVSWIHEEDFCRCVHWLIENPEANGIYNLTAPEPLPNRDFMRLLREKNGHSVGLAAPKWLLEIGAWLLRTETELILKSRRVEPERLEREGFGFHVSTMEECLERLERGKLA